MRTKVGWTVIFIGTTLLMNHRCSSAQEAREATDSPKFDFAGAAAKYAIQVRGNSKECELFQVPVLKWTNPIRGTVAGSVFLWTHDGIPQAACCMYAYRSGEKFAVDHEFVSLAAERIEARFDGQVVWQPEKPGVTWSPVPNAPKPASSRPKRLIQMRSVATFFTGYLGTPETQRQELRLLSQPIYRFPDTKDSDGGTFAFAETTDPETLLMFRVNLQAQEPTWEFAAARMTMVHAFLTVEEKVVWSAAWWNPTQESTYLTRGNVPFSLATE